MRHIMALVLHTVSEPGQRESTILAPESRIYSNGFSMCHQGSILWSKPRPSSVSKHQSNPRLDSERKLKRVLLRRGANRTSAACIWGRSSCAASYSYLSVAESGGIGHFK